MSHFPFLLNAGSLKRDVEKNKARNDRGSVPMHRRENKISLNCLIYEYECKVHFCVIYGAQCR